jgi:hypothetical protein
MEHYKKEIQEIYGTLSIMESLETSTFVWTYQLRNISKFWIAGRPSTTDPGC